jgi:WD40 repeat protein
MGVRIPRLLAPVAVLSLAACYTVNAQVDSVAFSPDGETLATGGGGRSESNFLIGGTWKNYGTVTLWNARTGAELQTLSGHDHPVMAVAFSPDGKEIASGSYDGTTRFWGLPTGNTLRTVKSDSERMVGGGFVALSPDGRWLATSNTYRWATPFMEASGWSAIALFDVASGKVGCRLSGHKKAIEGLAFNPTGETLASASLDGTIRTWSIPGGAERVTILGHKGPVFSVAFSPDGRQIVSASGDRTVAVWDAHDGRELLTLIGHTAAVVSVALSPDGKTIASGSADRTIRLWERETGKELLVLKGHSGMVRSVAFSPSGRLLASGGAWGDNTVRIWEVESGKEVRVLHGH